MVKLSVTPLNYEHAVKLSQKGINKFVISVDKFTQITDCAFSMEDIKKTVDLKIDVAVVLNRIIHNDMLIDLEKTLNQLSSLGVSEIIYSDIAVYQLITKNNYKFKLHYSPDTYTTNSKVIEFWNNKGVKAFSPANELSLRAIRDLNVPENMEMTLNAFGHIPMFVSKRKLLSNYGESQNIDVQQNKWYKIQELERSSDYWIREDQYGTYIVTFETLNILDEIREIKKANPTYLYINGLLKNTQQINDAVDAFNLVLNSDQIKKFGLIELERFRVKYPKEEFTKGFYYKYTMYKL